MTLRTPRRRISPRTKRRYRAIREFFRRAIGSSSQPEIEADNVTDLKHKIVGLEQQLNQVSQHCRKIVSSENYSKKSDSVVHTQLLDDVKAGTTLSLDRKVGGETKVLYKPTANNYRKSESDCTPKTCHSNESRSENFEVNKHYSKIKKKKSKLDNSYDLRRHRPRSVSDNFSAVYSASSFHSLLEARMAQVEPEFSGRHNRKQAKREYFKPISEQVRDNKIREYLKYREQNFIRHPEQKQGRPRKSKHCERQLDQGFIADIIKRQYRPVKMFGGRRESDVSQFSAPICRDQEFSHHEDIQEGTELCSCCYDNHRPIRTRHDDLCEMRSICDTRLYSSKRHKRHRHRRDCGNVYNDSDLYDLIPVKERSSPKSRRKFTEDNMTAYCYREVQPSPRTLRPKLNLKTQYYNDYEDYSTYNKRPSRKCSPNRVRRPQEVVDTFESDLSSEIQRHRNLEYRNKLTQDRIPSQPPEQITQDAGTMSSLQYPIYNDPNVTPNTSLNKTRETDFSVDKTDKALCEIKDILQNFLHEIKKETASQCDKSDISNKVNSKDIGEMQQNNAKNNTSIMPNSGHSFNNNLAHCSMPPPYMPGFPNPCCYPILPICPMNCVQNGYIVPSPSYTCTNCANPTPKEALQTDKQCKKTTNKANDICNPETEELIKEIYKYVAQSPRAHKNDRPDKSIREGKRIETKILTSRSVGGSSKASKHDAKVGTPRTKCYSKSCEAIGSRMISDTYYSGTNATYSDTILEKLSLEATATDSTSETDFDSTDVEKKKKNKFANVLRSFGIFKKKKKDVIEELSESESTIEVDIKPKLPPFRQDITNYSMYGQEYFQRPLVGPYEPRNPQCYQDYPHPPCNPEYPPVNDIYNSHRPHLRQHHEPLHYQSAQQRELSHHQPGPSHHYPGPSAPPYHSYENYNHLHPQVPLCLKEIEVKSIGTQSERKMSFLRKMKTKIQTPGQIPQNMDYRKTCSTQTAQTKPTLFNWKNLQNLEPKMNDPMNFTLKTQRELAQGNVNMKKALMKKLFYKRNPFSPRNLIVKTLLGKDKSSFGAPPRMYKPRMFF
ncbi:hypothetical protein K1T71_003639 [Dendrolimus kikuchii]|uniref:Uncharacterized protein n=1 Tax=Dendrolimus kikuchii TaxID=765133 RepID=A0ACC1D8Q5_9NEOP|nr:hypothetical protein K1T71_003639 [Dendrolimus kikuchii]